MSAHLVCFGVTFSPSRGSDADLSHKIKVKSLTRDRDLAARTIQKFFQTYCARKKKRRELIIKQLISSEEEYVSSLQAVVNLTTKLQKKKFMTQNEISNVFSNINILNQFHSKFLSDLRSANKTPFLSLTRVGSANELLSILSPRASRQPSSPKSTIRSPASPKSSPRKQELTPKSKELRHRSGSWRLSTAPPSPSLGDVISKFIPFLKIYTNYIGNVSKGTKLLQIMRKKDYELDEFLNSLKPEFNGFDISDILLKPLSRLKMYDTLLRDLKRSTLRSDPDYKKVEEASKSMAEVNEHLSKREHEMGYLSHVLPKLQVLFREWFRDGLLKPHRQFIREGKMCLIYQDMEYQVQCFLFSDMLLLADEKGVLRKALHIVLLSPIEHDESFENSFSFKLGETKYIFKASNKDEQKIWISDLNSRRNEEREKRCKTLSIEITDCFAKRETLESQYMKASDEFIKQRNMLEQHKSNINVIETLETVKLEYFKISDELIKARRDHSEFTKQTRKAATDVIKYIQNIQHFENTILAGIRNDELLEGTCLEPLKVDEAYQRFLDSPPFQHKHEEILVTRNTLASQVNDLQDKLDKLSKRYEPPKDPKQLLKRLKYEREKLLEVVQRRTAFFDEIIQKRKNQELQNKYKIKELKKQIADARQELNNLNRQREHLGLKPHPPLFILHKKDGTPNRLSRIIEDKRNSGRKSQSLKPEEPKHKTKSPRGDINDQLFKAAQSGNVKKLLEILETPSNRHKLRINEMIDANMTPLHAAASNNHIDAVRVLLDHGANVDAVDRSYRSALHIASSNGSKEIVVELVGRGANVNIRDIYGNSPLHLAMKAHNFPICEDLMLFGADINFKRHDGQTCLHDAMYRGDLEVLEWILALPRHVHIFYNAKDEIGETPLFKAVAEGHVHCIEYMLRKQKSGITIQNECGRNLFHIAAKHGRVKVFEFFKKTDLITRQLLEQLLDEVDIHKQTPLHVAVKNNQIEIVKLLIEMRADMNIQDKNGDTAMHLAINSGKLECAALLWMRGAKRDVKNKDNLTVKKICKAKNLNLRTLAREMNL